MNELLYKSYKAQVSQCSCCNKYINDNVFVFNGNWVKLSDVISVKADTVEKLQEEFEISINEYLSFE